MENRKKKSTCKTFICNDCTFIFQVYADLEKRRFYCPQCGDQINVRVYKKTRQAKQKRFWSAEEMQDLDMVLKGELKPYQLSVKHGRTGKAIRNRLSERRKELNEPNKNV